MTRFYDLLRSSVLVQALIALSTLFVILYLYATGQEPPQTLVNVFLIILGFYFGSKTQQINYERMIQNENRNGDNSD